MLFSLCVNETPYEEHVKCLLKSTCHDIYRQYERRTSGESCFWFSGNMYFIIVYTTVYMTTYRFWIGIMQLIHMRKTNTRGRSWHVVVNHGHCPKRKLELWQRFKVNSPADNWSNAGKLWRQNKELLKFTESRVNWCYEGKDKQWIGRVQRIV